MIELASPFLEIVAGPNGSGKSTFAESYLVRSLNRTSYLNPDLIAAAVAPGAANLASFQAGRILLREIKARISANEDVGFETTLAGMTYLRTIEAARAHGFNVRIYFVFTDNVRINIARIKKRVEMGGHHIPTRDVLRRYKRCLANFWNHYRACVNDWVIFNNSGDSPKFIHSMQTFEPLTQIEKDRFAKAFLKGRLPNG